MVIDWDKWEVGAPEKLKELDKRIFDDYVKRKINLSDLQNEYIKKYGEEVKNLIIKYNENFEKKAERFDVNEKLVSDIRKLTDYKKFLWSSNTRGAVKGALKIAGLENTFEKIVTRNDVKMIKPYLDGFEIINSPKIDKKKYLFVGDSGSDLKATKNAGIDFFQVTYFRDNLDRY